VARPRACCRPRDGVGGAHGANGEHGGYGLTDGFWSARSHEPPFRRAQTPAERGSPPFRSSNLKNATHMSRAQSRNTAPHPRGFDVFATIIFSITNEFNKSR